MVRLAFQSNFVHEYVFLCEIIKISLITVIVGYITTLADADIAYSHTCEINLNCILIMCPNTMKYQSFLVKYCFESMDVPFHLFSLLLDVAIGFIPLQGIK